MACTCDWDSRSLTIYGEVLQEVSHYLLSKTGRLEGIKKIYSHPHAIAQCRNWLETNLPNVPVSEVPSTARAAELCRGDASAAAIASELAGQLDPELFWQIHRSTLVNTTAIAGVTRDERGRQLVTIKGRPEKLEVSRSYSHLFKGM